MAGPTRPLPTVGAAVTVVYLDGAARGTVTSVDENLRSLEVLTEDGLPLRFELSRATGRFVSGGQSGARLRFDSERQTDEQ